jgi:hypothetical protein
MCRVRHFAVSNPQEEACWQVQEEEERQHYQLGRPACPELGVYLSPAAIAFIGCYSRQPKHLLISHWSHQ